MFKLWQRMLCVAPIPTLVCKINTYIEVYMKTHFMRFFLFLELPHMLTTRACGMAIWSFRLSSLSRSLLCARGNSPVGRHPSEGSPP